MTKTELEKIARKMYELAKPTKYEYFRQAIYPDGSGKTVPWPELDFEQDWWMEAADIAVKAINKINKGKKDEIQKNPS